MHEDEFIIEEGLIRYRCSSGHGSDDSSPKWPFYALEVLLKRRVPTRRGGGYCEGRQAIQKKNRPP
jgi:hypothetical protein